MSGCARCVYDLHFEALQDYQEDITKARNSLLSLSPPLTDKEWVVSLLGPRPGPIEGDERTAAEKAHDEVDAVIGNLDPSMKAFLQLERSLKRKGIHSTSGKTD
jgi:aarF domain-containing kinase